MRWPQGCAREVSILTVTLRTSSTPHEQEQPYKGRGLLPNAAVALCDYESTGDCAPLSDSFRRKHSMKFDRHGAIQKLLDGRFTQMAR